MAVKKKKRISKTTGTARVGRPPKGSGPSKSAFIRAKLKAGMTPADIVTAGAKQGLKIATALVHKVKSRSTPETTRRGKGRPGPKPQDGKPTASDFIRRQPLTMKANDVVAAGKKRGVKFTLNLVYGVRSAAKKNGGTGRGKGKPGRKLGSAAAEEQFKDLLPKIGLDRARALIDEADSWGRRFGVT
jgi:hypothetical protein